MTKSLIQAGKTALGIELGSTRIKAVLIETDTFQTLASGSSDWENEYVNGYWTYAIENVWSGIQKAYQELKTSVHNQYDCELATVGAIGISGMMHGYLPFDKQGTLLTPFRTWRNTTTEEAARKLTDLFHFAIPQRWSIAHLYQAILNQEEHVASIDFVTTIAGYVHWQLTGEKVVGVGEASGMFPIDSQTNTYDESMLDKIQTAVNADFQLVDIFPTVKSAGENAGTLSEDGAKLLDPSGTLQAGIPLVPPEGDAGTGMVATNSIKERTGNVSAGTSVFSMVVLENPLQEVHEEIDLVTTPDGKPVAMVHCNNFTSDLNAWVNLFEEVITLSGGTIDKGDLFRLLFQKSQQADENVGKLMSVPFYAGEPIATVNEGRPLFVRMPDSSMTLANVMKTHLYGAVATLALGMRLLTERENVQIDTLYGHGGFFKTPEVGQQVMADALQTAVTILETAGEGGPWGMAVLAAYGLQSDQLDLSTYLSAKVFADQQGITLAPTQVGMASFASFLAQFEKSLRIEQVAAEQLN